MKPEYAEEYTRIDSWQYRLIRQHSRECHEKCIAFIARVLLEACPSFKSILPVYIEYEPFMPKETPTSHYAMILTTHDGRQKILGSVAHIYDRLKRLTERCYRAWDADVSEFVDIYNTFASSPILRVSDVVTAVHVKDQRTRKDVP